MKKSVLLVVAFCLNVAVFAQSYPPNGLDGSALRTWLKSNWYDGFHSNLGYDNARIAMYDRIDKAADGDVYCVYTGFHQPSQNTTFLNPINAEHTVPQSWFNQANPMRSDIHHLFPTHMNVNSSRGSLPFAEIPDNQTDNWYIVNSSNTGITTSSSIPSSNIDAYSERNTNVSFEVREDHKGNTARAIFYFYTMYPTQAGSIDEIGDINELYQWHLDDPVDAWEQQRNARTKDEQGNFNPYISHPELVARAWGFAPIPTVDFEAMTGTISEGNSGSQTYQITVEASSAPSSAVTMNIAVDASSTATAGVDFTLSTTSVTLTNSNFSKTVSVNILGDTDFENNETIVLKLQNLSGDATLGDDTHTITITNDDAQPEINFTASSGDETEGNSGTKTYQTMVSISPAPLSAVTVDVEVVGGTATENVDYTLSTSTLTFNNSTTSQPVSITINGDTEFEGDETVILDLENISGSANLGSNASHTLTITNDDTQPAISFNAATGSIEEGNSGTKSYETTVNISPAPTEEITVAVGAGSGTAISGTDYTLSTTSLTFNSTTTSQTVTVMIQGDEDAESDETVVLELANVTGNATLGTTTAHTLTIANDDAPCTEPSTAASALTPSAVTMTTATLSWTAGNGESRLVLMKSGSDFTASDLPVNGNTYAASASFGDGASIGSAFVVFNGTGNSVDVSNLAMNTTYFVQVIEYACSPILYKASGNATTEFTSADFAAATQISFTQGTGAVASEGQETFTLQLNEALNAESTVELLVNTTNGLVNGTDFSTSPSSTSGTLNFIIPAESNQVSFSLTSLTSNFGEVNFTILNTSNNLTATNPNTLVITISEPTGLEDDLEAAGISIFPNPATTGVFIQQQHFSGKTFQVGLFTLTGQEIKSEDYQKADVFYSFPKLTKGVYLIRLMIDDTRYFKRILVE